MQAARVVSGSLVTDIDMAGALSPSPSLPPAAGNCWLRQARNGRCQVLYKTDLSKEECCKTGRLTTSWTEEDVNDNTLFKWMIFNGGAPNCIPCKGEVRAPAWAGGAHHEGGGWGEQLIAQTPRFGRVLDLGTVLKKDACQGAASSLSPLSGGKWSSRFAFWLGKRWGRTCSLALCRRVVLVV